MVTGGEILEARQNFGRAQLTWLIRLWEAGGECGPCCPQGARAWVELTNYEVKQALRLRNVSLNVVLAGTPVQIRQNHMSLSWTKSSSASIAMVRLLHSHMWLSK